MAHRKIPKALERELSRLEETAKTLQNNYANAVSFYNTVAEGCKRWKQYDYQDLLYPTTLKVVAHINCHRLPTARQLGEGRWSLNPDRLIATFGPEILLSEKFLRKLRDFMKLSEMVFDEALQSLMIQQNIRRSHPRAGVSSRRLWAPADVEKAMDALGLSKKKRSLNEAEIEPPESDVQLEPRQDSLEQDAKVESFTISASPSVSRTSHDFTIEQQPNVTLRNTKKPCHSFPNNSLQVNDGATESSAQYQGQVEKARTAQLSDQAISDDEWTHTESENEEPSNAGSKTFLNFSECEDEGVESFPGELFAGSDTPVDLNGLHGVATHADADTVDREAADILQMLHGSHSPINLVGSEGAIIDADADTVDREAVDVLQMLQPGKWLAHSAVFRILRNFGIFRIIDVGNIPPAAERHLWTFPTLSRSRLSEEVLFCPLVLSDRDHWVLLYFARSTHQVIHLDSLLSTNLKPDNLEYVAKMIVKSLGHVWDDEHWTLVRDKTIPQQKNSYDCGLYVILYCLFAMELQSIPPNISAHTHLWRILFSGLVRGQLTELEKTDLFLIPVHAHSQEKSSDPFARLLQAESVTCHSIQRMDSFQEVCRQWNVFALSLQSRTAQKSACTKKLREEHDFLVEQLRAYNNGCLSRGIYSKSVDVVRKALNSAVAEANKALKQHEVTRRYLESNFEKVDKITKELAQLKAGLTLKFEKIQAQRMEVEMWKEKLKDEFKDEWFS